jgi:hypothetical protein
MVLVVLLSVSVLLSVVLGVLSKMPLAQIVAQASAMCAAALLFYGLVELL